MNYTHAEISDTLSEMEQNLSERNELAPFDMNTLRDIETSVSDPNIVERIKKIRHANEHFLEFSELPENWESDPHG